MGSSALQPLRQTLDERVAGLRRDVEYLVEAYSRKARQETADQFNRAVRLLRQAEDAAGLRATLVDAAGAFAQGLALFLVEAESAKGERAKGVADEVAAAFADLAIPFSDAPALVGVAQGGEPMATATVPSEVSPRLAELFGHTADDRAWIFPVSAYGRVAALVYAWGAVEASSIELLTQVAGVVWNVLPKPAPVGLISILPVVKPVEVPRPASAWDSLSPEDQRLHLRAQRFARVEVAGMMLRHSAEVKSGRALRNLYSALRKPVDEARERFRSTYFSPCASMVDYLHIELVRTLANDNPELLGKDYPGIMV